MAARRWEGEDDAMGAAVSPRPDAPTENPVDAGEDGAPAAAAPTAAPRRRRHMLQESHLLSRDGLPKLVETFPYRVQGGVAGREAEALQSLVRMYKQWAYDLYPGLNFEDFVDRTEALGKAHGVQNLVSEMQTQEMRRNAGLTADGELPAEPADAMADEAFAFGESRILGAADQDDGDQDDEL